MMFATLCTLTGVVLLMRALPFLFSKWAERAKWLVKVGVTLPACVMLLLVAHCIEAAPFGLAEGIGLTGVLMAQLVWRNLLISMLAGVALQQAFLYFF